MFPKVPLSKTTRNNWLINTALFLSAVLASLSGIYFLFLPSGGYMGGRNPYYGIVILFERHTWDDLHTWTGVAMIAAALVHFAIHWKWVAGMARRLYNEITGRCECMNARGRFNLITNLVVGLSFFLSAVSGLYFLFFPENVLAPQIILTRTGWDLVHTWASVVMMIAAIIHFTIHWQWVVKVSRRMFAGVSLNPARVKVQIENQM